MLQTTKHDKRLDFCILVSEMYGRFLLIVSPNVNCLMFFTDSIDQEVLKAHQVKLHSQVH